MTPFEKNLEVWKQLWRVVERSHVIVQIVDARNPVLFRSIDLERYVKEVDGSKKSMLLVNKADYLTPAQRRLWAEYFEAEGIAYRFWSASAAAMQEAQAEVEQAAAEQSPADSSEGSYDSGEESEGESDAKDRSSSEEANASSGDESAPIKDRTGATAGATNADVDPVVDKTIHVYSRSELVRELEAFGRACFPDLDMDEPLVVGMVGYPNVGKSSTINVLVGRKAVSVSATPGKTKRLQTIPLHAGLLLCDCPGLVFPSFVATRAEMVLNGLLPIDQLRDHRPPVELLCARIPRFVLQRRYGIVLPKPNVESGEVADRPPTAAELLQSFADVRGFVTGRGIPDEARAARIVLKDFVSGRLLHCVPPPSESLRSRWIPWFDDEEYRNIGVTPEMEVELARDKKRRLQVAKSVDPNREVVELEMQKQVVAHTTGGRRRAQKNFTRVSFPYARAPVAQR